jgi:hypothetical protein
MKARQMKRRNKVAQLMVEYPPVHGRQARIARLLNVSEATISRDVRRLYEIGRMARGEAGEITPEPGSDLGSQIA